jgi:transcription elongation factor Elf1
MPKRRPRPQFFNCPHCGAQVRVGAAACRACGSDADTGWSDEAETYAAGFDAGYGGEDDFDYDEYIREEFPDQAAEPPATNWKRWVAVVIILLVCAAMLRMF